MNLSKKEVEKLLPEVSKLAKKILVFTELKYVKTKTFDYTGKNSVYHIFGAFNKTYNCMQSVTYSPTSKSISFSLHTIEASI